MIALLLARAGGKTWLSTLFRLEKLSPKPARNGMTVTTNTARKAGMAAIRKNLRSKALQVRRATWRAGPGRTGPGRPAGPGGRRLGWPSSSGWGPGPSRPSCPLMVAPSLSRPGGRPDGRSGPGGRPGSWREPAPAALVPAVFLLLEAGLLEHGVLPAGGERHGLGGCSAVDELRDGDLLVLLTLVEGRRGRERRRLGVRGDVGQGLEVIAGHPLDVRARHRLVDREPRLVPGQDLGLVERRRGQVLHQLPGRVLLVLGDVGVDEHAPGAERHARVGGQALRGLETDLACDGRARRRGELMAGEGGDPVVVHGHFALVEVVHAVDGREGADALGGVLGHQLLVERGPLERARGVEQ